jgi:Ser/Thr protein kinase RdoA (MazF antagonist)
MFADPFERQAHTILAGYDFAIRSCKSLGNAGGFSGARIWRVEAHAGDWCLKAWPPAGMDLPRLADIHSRMIAARAAGLEIVPLVMRRRDGSTCAAAADRAWDLVEWMPGVADFSSRPDPLRMTAALNGLSRLHAFWRASSAQEGVAPAIEHRLDRLDDWQKSIRSGWELEIADSDTDPLVIWTRQAWQLLPPHLDSVRPPLESLKNTVFRLHTCLGDIWHDHVLFEGNRLTGLIDYGALRTDSPATDLARLLGSLAPCDNALFALGLQSYQVRIPLSFDEVRLVHILDYSGTVIGIANWLLWIYRDRRPQEDRAAAAGRLAILVQRLAGMRHSVLA